MSGRQHDLNRFSTFLSAIVVLIGVGGCGAAAGFDRSGPVISFSTAVPLGLDAFAAIPEENPLTREKVELGRRLFFDTILSLDRSRSCASCHRPDAAFADSVPISPGIRDRRTSRNASTLVNRVYGQFFFWDGRAASLEEAVLMPIMNPDELALPIPELLRRLNSDRHYRHFFREAFGDEAVSQTAVARVLASYVRTLRGGDAPVDRYLAGDTAALPIAARRGRLLFLGKAGCADCHSGPTFTDERFHNTGVSFGSDMGRYGVTHDSLDLGRFKTPTLREVARTAPYMHDGSLNTLEEVVAFYNDGGRANPNLDRDIRALHLTSNEKDDLVAFLRSLRT